MSYQASIARIDALRTAIQQHGPLSTEVLKKVNYKFRLEWNYTSNSMEGNSLTRSETRSVMIGNITVHGKPIKDVLEMKGHDEVISSILKLGAGELQLSESRIRDIHRGIMHEEDPEKVALIGKWKTQDNYLYNYKNERVDFLPHEEVPNAMHRLTDWLAAQREKIARGAADSLHPVSMAFRFHLDYVFIHPFYDGNGRTARILTNLILIAYGYPPIWVKEDERSAYYQYLGDVKEYGGDPDVFFEFMAGTLLRSQQIVLDAVEGREIEERSDLDKKIALLKKRLGISHQAQTGLTYSSELVTEFITSSIIPFAEVWESRLKAFDGLFQSRSILFTSSNGAHSERDVSKGMLSFYIRLLSVSLQSNEKIQFIKLQCEFRNLLTVKKQMSINGGEVNFVFYENRYEVFHAGNKLNPLNKLYGEQLSDEEITATADSVSNWLYNNIEIFLQDEEQSQKP